MLASPSPVPGVRPRRRGRLVVAAALAVLATVAATVVALRAITSPSCSANSPTVAVAADPALAATLAAALGTEQTTADGTCTRVRVTAQRSADITRDVAAGHGPQLWVADSTSSVQLALPPRGGAAPTAETGPSLVRSPLVAVTDPDAATRAGWTQAPPSWAALLGGALPVSIADPTATGEGLLALLSATATLGVIDPADPPVDVVNGLVRLGRTPVADPQQAVRDRAAAPAFIATEQAALASGAGGALTMAYPAEGSIPLDYPVVRVRRPAEPPDLEPAVTAVQTALRSDTVLAALHTAGFRDPTGRLSEQVLDTDAPLGALGATPAALPALPDALTRQVLGLWSTLTTSVQMLLAFDVSGSTAEPAASGATRIELARDVGLTALALFEERSRLGAWSFARGLGPNGDRLELTGLDELGRPEDGGTHRDAVRGAIASLSGLVGGNTALFDAALAAVRHVQADYETDRINAVALVTDGSNDDDGAGIDLPLLVDTLRREANPARPVPVFAIGVGPDADLGELTAIAEATGGRAYVASTPSEIQRVFFDAYARWTCRGAC